MKPWRTLTEGLYATAMNAIGDMVEFRPKPAGEAIRRRVIVDNQHLAFTSDGQVPVSASEPVLTIKLSDFPQPPNQDDEGTILEGIYAGKTFRIIDRLEDGQGGAELPLRWI